MCPTVIYVVTDVITDQARFLTRSTQTQPMHSAFGCDVFKAYSLSLF